MWIMNCCTVLLCIWSVSLSSGWQFYDSLNFLRTNDEGKEAHTEFIYGECKKDPNNSIILFEHVHLSSEDINLKAIARGWLRIYRVPTCVKVRATFKEKDMFRTTAYKFQMCTPVITFIYAQDRYRYFYYEWFLPDETLAGVEWDLYFYGPPKREWGQTPDEGGGKLK